MKKSEISKTFYQKLTCRLYILGAPSEGESILFIVYGDDQVIYSCITDSFSIKDTNIPMACLEHCNLDHVTEIFWSHPHDDHSNGLIDLIEKYKPEFVYIPADLQELPEETPKTSRDVLMAINDYHSCDERHTYQPCIIDIGTNYMVLEQILNVRDKKVPFSIYAIAPVTGRVRRDVITDNYSKLNDFSIAISITIGDFSLLLTGDIQDRMIKYIPSNLQKVIPTPNLLKIPHHGSKHSLNIISLFDNTIPIDAAISTAKKTSHLPRTEALDFYTSYCKRVYRICGKSEDVAVWGISIDIMEATIHEIDLQGYSIFPDE